MSQLLDSRFPSRMRALLVIALVVIILSPIGYSVISQKS